jgi:hypothetical protein
LEELSFELDLEHGGVVGTSAPFDEVASAARAVRVAPAVARQRAPEDAAEGSEPSAAVASVEELDGAPSEQATTPARPIDLGIGPDGWQRWATPPQANAEARAARPPRSNRFQVYNAPPVSTTGGLQEGLEQRDRELGLGPSGRVLSVLHKVAHSEAAPALGAARFDVTVLRTGAVEVTLSASSGQPEQWRKIAKQIASELRAAPPKIPPPRDGMKLKVELAAEQVMPDGTKVSTFKPLHLEAPPLKLKSTEQAKAQLQADNPTTETPNADTLPATNLEQPGLYVAGRGKLGGFRAGIGVLPPAAQSYGEGATPLALSAQGHLEPAHAGAKSQRRVRASVIEQTLF